MREIRNELSYTVSHIGDKMDLLAWKIKQRIKAEQDEMKTQVRVDQVKYELDKGLLADKHKTTQDSSRATKKYYAPPKLVVLAHSHPHLIEKSMITRVYQTILNFFLDIKYN